MYMKKILSRISEVLLASTVVLNSGAIIPAFAQNYTEKP